MAECIELKKADGLLLCESKNRLSAEPDCLYADEEFGQAVSLALVPDIFFRYIWNDCRRLFGEMWQCMWLDSQFGSSIRQEIWSCITCIEGKPAHESIVTVNLRPGMAAQGWRTFVIVIYPHFCILWRGFSSPMARPSAPEGPLRRLFEDTSHLLGQPVSNPSLVQGYENNHLWSK